MGDDFVQLSGCWFETGSSSATGVPEAAGEGTSENGWDGWTDGWWSPSSPLPRGARVVNRYELGWRHVSFDLVVAPRLTRVSWWVDERRDRARGAWAVLRGRASVED